MAALACAGSLAFASQAHAFSDPLSFSDPVDLGGGGGRWFTGSAIDGYGCDVCHSGKPGPEVTLVGLPLAGYVPGTAYEVRVEWPSELEHIGLALEISDESGEAAGSLRLPPDDELAPAESCEPAEDGIGAGVLTELDTRTILSVPDCGARRTRFLWTAPSEARGVLRLAGGLVASDGEADFANDGVTLFAHVLPPARSGQQLASKIEGGCSVGSAAPWTSRMHWPWAALCAGALVLCWRRRA